MRCFLDHNRTCEPDVQKSEGPRCRMWDTQTNDCVLVQLARKYTGDLVTYTAFPESAPPPEVK